MWPTEWIRGGHTSVRAMPRSYQVTPVDPRAATGDTAKASQTQSRSTGKKRVSPPPPGSQTDEPDDTDRRGRRLSLRRGAGRPGVIAPSPALPLVAARLKGLQLRRVLLVARH